MRGVKKIENSFRCLTPSPKNGVLSFFYSFGETNVSVYLNLFKFIQIYFRVAQAYLNQKKIEEEVKQLHQNMAQFSKQTQQWVQLIGNFNGSLKQIGDLENWSRIMESDMKFISETLEHTYNGNDNQIINLYYF